MHEFNSLDSPNAYEEITNCLFVLSDLELDVAQVQSLAGRVKRERLTITKPELVLVRDVDLGLGGLIR